MSEKTNFQSFTFQDVWRCLRFILPLAGFSLLGYLAASAWMYRSGFPLDDAWIHQTYARSLALHGEWAFTPGQPSAGSTSPLWTLLLVPGYWFGIAPLTWSFLLGWLILTCTGLVSIWIYRMVLPEKPALGIWVGVLMILEWHLVWASGSGMETLFFTLIVLLVLGLTMTGDMNWIKLGLLVGISLWIRPDGLTLLGPVLLFAFIEADDWRTRFASMLRFCSGLLLLLIPYLLFNFFLSGSIWPNTFFAKQAEYAVHREIPFVTRVLQQASLALVGPGLLMLPGFFWFLWNSLVRRAWSSVASAIWALGFVLLYALRLPVTYQHGRYVIPAMAVYFLLGLIGIADWIRLDASEFWRRIISRVWAAALLVTTVSFWVLGARAYASDVAVIESEMVESAKWIALETEPGSLIAAHDIGALGYFGSRELLDLAGLVSPEVIPLIRDEGHLATFLDIRNVDYLMTFPGWYPELVKLAEPVFNSNGAFSPAQGGENMQVFRWR